jgi:prepilin-type N-terminal cleavage/methylation domain-containing protein
VKINFLNKMSEIKSNNKGFTVLELIMVTIIIGILVATAAPRFMGTVDRAESAVEDAVLDALLSNAESYAMETFMETGRKSYPYNPFLGATVDGYVGNCCEAQVSGDWSYKDGYIMHIRGDDSKWRWSYTSANIESGQADDRGAFGSRAAVSNVD